MKSKNLRQKQLSDYSSQDELAKGRTMNGEKAKRSKKPSIYDDLDDDLDDVYSSNYDDDAIDEYDDDDDYLDEDEDEDDRY